MKFYFSKFILFLKFVFFPRSTHLKGIVYDEVQPIKFVFKEEGLPLIISFAGLGSEFNFMSTVKDFNVNMIFVRDVKHNWYLNGLLGVGETLSEINLFLKGKISECKPTKVIVLGVSAGGFAAILYGCLLKANRILAFSPQTFMNKLNCIFHLDYRWLDRVLEIYDGDRSNREYLDVKTLVTKTKIPIVVVYDKTHRLDSIHATRVRCDHVEVRAFSGGGHLLAKTLKNEGLLTKMILEALG